MKKQNKIIGVIAIIVVVTLFTPIILWGKTHFTNFSNDINSTVLAEFSTFQTLILSFWGFILNIVLVYIAYKVYNNFDVKKQFRNKQQEVLSELVQSINATVLSKKEITPGKSTLTNFECYTSGVFEFASKMHNLEFTLCVNEDDLEEVFPFLKYRNYLLLPKPIVLKLKILYKNLKLITKEALEETKIIIVSREVKEDSKKNTDKKHWEYYKSPIEFKQDVLSLKTEIINWYNDYGVKDLNI